MPVPKKLPSQKLLARLLRYDATTGFFYWKPREVSDFTQGCKFTPEANCARWNTRFANQRAFTAVERRRGYPRGHHVGILFCVRYKAHRIIWKLVHGKDPEYIDHIDGNPENNCLLNLREVTHQSNMRNQKLRCTNTSGFNGVRPKKNTWVARVRRGDTNLFLGSFPTFEEAKAARQAYDREHGFHPNHGRARA